MTAPSPETLPPVLPGMGKTVCIDFDGTIVPWGPPMGPKDPFPGVPAAMRALRDAGYNIVIFTSRLSEWWINELGEDWTSRLEQRDYITGILTANDIPFDHLTGDKVPAAAYFDDNAVRVTERFPLPLAIQTFMAGLLAR